MRTERADCNCVSAPEKQTGQAGAQRIHQACLCAKMPSVPYTAVNGLATPGEVRTCLLSDTAGSRGAEDRPEHSPPTTSLWPQSPRQVRMGPTPLQPSAVAAQHCSPHRRVCKVPVCDVKSQVQADRGSCTGQLQTQFHPHRRCWALLGNRGAAGAPGQSIDKV